MTTQNFPFRLAAPAAAVLATLAWPAAARAEERAVDEHRPADANGQVEIQDVEGRIEVSGWDKAELAVTGTLSPGVERLDITSAGAHTTLRVVMHESHGPDHWRGDRETHLVVHVPTHSSLTTTLVSADLKVSGISGNQDLHTVSGDVTTAAQHEVRINTVSGDAHLTAGPETRLVEVATVSGDVTVSGGGGDVNVSTVSGDGALTLGAVSRAHFKTVSGDFTVAADLAADGRLDAESVSGGFRIKFTGAMPPAAYELQSFSGDLTTCFGRKATHEGYGPGSRLTFQEGAGTAHVRVDTKSGDVTLCGKK